MNLWRSSYGTPYVEVLGLFWVEAFLERALSHQTVYIRVTENLGRGDQFYAKFGT